MSPGSQMRALTANNANTNSSTMAAGNSTERNTFTGQGQGLGNGAPRTIPAGGAFHSNVLPL